MKSHREVKSEQFSKCFSFEKRNQLTLPIRCRLMKEKHFLSSKSWGKKYGKYYLHRQLPVGYICANAVAVLFDCFAISLTYVCCWQSTCFIMVVHFTLCTMAYELMQWRNSIEAKMKCDAKWLFVRRKRKHTRAFLSRFLVLVFTLFVMNGHINSKYQECGSCNEAVCDTQPVREIQKETEKRSAGK